MPGSMELLADRDPEEVRFSTLESSSAEQASPARDRLTRGLSGAAGHVTPTHLHGTFFKMLGGSRSRARLPPARLLSGEPPMGRRPWHLPC
jgi:hypothetical protein